MFLKASVETSWAAEDHWDPFSCNSLLSWVYYPLGRTSVMRALVTDKGAIYQPGKRRESGRRI